MVVVKVFPGPCAFEARIEAVSDGARRVRMTVESECPAVTSMAGELETLGLEDIVGKAGFGGVRPFQVAADTLFHATCPVLTAFLKAAEAELGLAVKRDVIIEFITEEE